MRIKRLQLVRPSPHYHLIVGGEEVNKELVSDMHESFQVQVDIFPGSDITCR